MVRKYVRKRPRQWRDKDKRMAAAVRLRAEGKSLREIGEVLRVGKTTIARDLERWDAMRAATHAENVVPMSQKLSQRTVPSCPPGGEAGQADGTEIATPILFRRKA